MTIQMSVAVRAAEADAIETAVGTSPKLQLRTGAKPANCAAANTGTLLAQMDLPSDWLTNPGTGVKALLGTWQDTSADAAGDVGHFRIFDTALANCHIQGSVTATGGGGDMTLDNINLAVGQLVVVTTFSLTEGNA